MSDKEMPSSLDAALAHMDPDRRKFLGILLAGVAAAPLLSSVSLAAEDKPSGQKAEHFPKHETSVKGNTAIKDGSANTIKMNDQKTQNIKFWDKTNSGNTGDLKNSNTIKNGGAIKGENSTIKLQPNAIKGENSTIKLQPNAIKGETKPAPH